MNFRIEERVPLSKLQIFDEIPSPMRHKIKICHNRLPNDFFAFRGLTPSSSPSNVGRRMEIYTQAQKRELGSLQRVSSTRQNVKKQGMSARGVIQQANAETNEINLILSVMSTSREMKKAFRKHSLDFKKENCSHKAENYRVELPPLLLKKGVSLPV